MVANTAKSPSSAVDEELRQFLESKRANIKVVGIGGAGNNAVSRMMQVGIAGAEVIAMNTDAQDLLYTDAEAKVLLGRETTKGLGAGADPQMGMESARETKDEIKKVLEGADMVFITCGLGGGTGTGAAPVVAEIAKKLGALTVAVVTLPFAMESYHRMQNAKEGLENLQKYCDTMVVVPNDRLLELVPDASIVTAFKLADEVLVNAVKGTTEIITKPGLINRDFADVRAIMTNGGLAMIGIGESDTENRAIEAIEKATNNPLLDVDIEGAKGALVYVSGGPDMSVKECNVIVEAVSSKLSPESKIIWGAAVNKEQDDMVRAMVIITGVKASRVYGATRPFSDERRRDIEKILGIDFVE